MSTPLSVMWGMTLWSRAASEVSTTRYAVGQWMLYRNTFRL